MGLIDLGLPICFELSARHHSKHFTYANAGHLDDLREGVVVPILWMRKLKFSHFPKSYSWEVASPASPCLILRLLVLSVSPGWGSTVLPFCVCVSVVLCLYVHSSHTSFLDGPQTKTESCPRIFALAVPLSQSAFYHLQTHGLLRLIYHLLRQACFNYSS